MTIYQYSYYAIRHEIKTGDLLVWSTDDSSILSAIFTRLVRLFTLSDYSHTAIAWVENKRVYAIDATIPRIKMSLLSECKDFYHIPMGITMTQEQQLELKTFIEDTYLDRRYGIMDCIRGYLGKTDMSNDSWQCAELCNHFYARVGIELGDAFTPTRLIRTIIRKFSAVIHYVEHG